MKLKSFDRRPDAVGIEIIVVPFVRADEVVWFELWDTGTDVVSSGVVAIEKDLLR